MSEAEYGTLNGLIRRPASKSGRAKREYRASSRRVGAIE